MNERVGITDKKPETKSQNLAPHIRRKTESFQSMSSPVDRILFLQRNIGNQAVGKLIKSGALQAKLRIGQPGDIYEQEADRVAEHVMRTDVSTEEDTGVQRKCPKCLNGLQSLLGKDKKDEKLQAKEASSEKPEVTPQTETNINALKGGGQPLPESTRAFFEPRFGQDFSQVRVHADAKAAESVNAQAYTVGGNVVFAGKKYSPETIVGKKLLAHELTHVIQQANQQVMPLLAIGTGDSSLERKAGCVVESLARSQQDNKLNSVESYAPASAFSLTTGFSQVPMELIQRQNPGKVKVPTKNPEIKFVYGMLRFTDKASWDLLKGGALLPGDKGVLDISPDGLLGYDANFTDPTDPFRWEKIKFVIDSGEKILMKKVAYMEKIPTRFITKDVATNGHHYMKDPGLTLPTEALMRRIYPTGDILASPIPDTHHIYCTADPMDPGRSSLAHELLGHMWLALKERPCVHPEKAADIIAQGTIEKKHKIEDPFGGYYSGTVKEFIDRYIGSEMFSEFKSPTQFVGIRLLEKALTNLKKEFAAKAKGQLNGQWEVPQDVALIWEIISTNYEIAEPADTKLQKSIEQDVTKWYASLNPDKQYIFIMYLKEVQKTMRKTKFTTQLLRNLKAPSGMRESIWE